MYISDTPVTLKQRQGHQTYKENVDPDQVIIMQSLEDLASTVSGKNQWFFFFFSPKEETLSVTSLDHVRGGGWGWGDGMVYS